MFETDLSGLEQLLNAADDLDFRALARELAEDGLRDTHEIMKAEIYSQPASPSYERSRKLTDTAKSYEEVDRDGFTVTLEARGGNKGRLYGEYVERGTYGSRISLEQIMRDARAQSSLEPLDYSRGENGMRARPSVMVAAAEMERQLEGKLLELIDKATK